jgi:hypothetical protein
VLGCTDPTLPSAKGTHFAAPFPGLRQDALDSSHEVGPRQLKYVRELKNGCERRTVFPALQKAYVFGVIATIEGKLFLREMTLLSELIQDPRERTFFGRALFVLDWHPQLGVCGLSINTSTKYSIHHESSKPPKGCTNSIRKEAA